MPARDHDSGYKLLFSDPLMVRDLVRGFVDDPWLQRLDFSTLEPVKGHYVSEDMRQRADDVVWRVRADEGWVYLYLLIEFQHAVDREVVVVSGVSVVLPMVVQRLDGQAHAHRLQDRRQGLEFGIALLGEGPVQGMSIDVGLTRNLLHTAERFAQGTQCQHQVGLVAVFQHRIEVVSG